MPEPTEIPWKKQANATIDAVALKDVQDGNTTIAILPSEDKAVLIRVVGPCPVCRHEGFYDYPLVAVSGVDTLSADETIATADILGIPSGAKDVRLTCECHETHSSQETHKEDGCGARWGINVRWGK